MIMALCLAQRVMALHLIQEFDTDSNVHDDNCQRSRVHSQHGQYDQNKIKQENLVPS